MAAISKVMHKGDNAVGEMVLEIVSSLANKEIAVNITPESRLKHDLGLDSLNMMELCVRIEGELNVSIADKLRGVDTVQDLIDLANSGGSDSHGMDCNIGNYPIKKTEKHIEKLKKYAKWSRILWKFIIIGRENIPTARNYILCPNHQSHFDSLWIWSAIGIDRIDPQKICCLAKQEHLESKMSKAFLGMLGGIPVDRSGNSAPAMKRAFECVKNENYNILIHPEGTRTLDGKMQAFKGGAAKLSIDANVPIIPVRIDGAWDIFPPHKKSPKIFRFGKRYPLKISFGKPIMPSGKSVDELTVLVQSEVEWLGDEK